MKNQKSIIFILYIQQTKTTPYLPLVKFSNHPSRSSQAKTAPRALPPAAVFTAGSRRSDVRSDDRRAKRRNWRLRVKQKLLSKFINSYFCRLFCLFFQPCFVSVKFEIYSLFIKILAGFIAIFKFFGIFSCQPKKEFVLCSKRTVTLFITFFYIKNNREKFRLCSKVEPFFFKLHALLKVFNS